METGMDANTSDQGSLFNPSTLPEPPGVGPILAGDVPRLIYHQLSVRIGTGIEKVTTEKRNSLERLRLVSPEHKMTGFAGAIALHEFAERTSTRSVFYLWGSPHSDWDTLDAIFKVSGGPQHTGGWAAVGGNSIWERVTLHTKDPILGIVGTSKALKVVAFICYFVARITENPRYQGRRYYEDDFLKDMTDWSPAN